jgi:hypothetical protein
LDLSLLGKSWQVCSTVIPILLHLSIFSKGYIQTKVE